MSEYDIDGFKPGSYGCHEALDRCSLLAGLVDEFAEHDAIRLNEKWHRDATLAAKLLADLYQSIGSVHLTLICNEDMSRTDEAHLGADDEAAEQTKSA